MVIAVIGILTALILPALARAKDATRKVHCLSNLRQTGVALQSWLNDNNDWLPPGQTRKFGLFMGQHPDYMAETTPRRYKYQLVYFLATYLGYPNPDDQLRTAPVFFCPAFEHLPGVNAISNNICYGVTSTNYFKDDAGNPKISFNPFGFPPGMDEERAHSSTLSQISAELPLSDVYSLVDIDQVALGEQPGASTWNLLPENPVHGNVRNYLFFDSHAASQKVGKPGTL